MLIIDGFNCFQALKVTLLPISVSGHCFTATKLSQELFMFTLFGYVGWCELWWFCFVLFLAVLLMLHPNVFYLCLLLQPVFSYILLSNAHFPSKLSFAFTLTFLSLFSSFSPNLASHIFLSVCLSGGQTEETATYGILANRWDFWIRWGMQMI